MNNNENKRNKVTILSVISIFVIYIVDIFLIKSDKTLFADSIVARIVGIVIIVFASKKIGYKLRKHCLGRYGWYFELAYGIGFSLAPIVAVYAAELVYFKIKGYYSEVIVSIYPPNMRGESLVAEFAIYIISLAVNVFFKEIFRGFLLDQLYPKFKAKKSNYLQAAMFTLMSFVPVIGILVNGEFGKMSTVDTVITIAASTCSCFISAVKWGYYYRVNGSVWMALADHFVNSFMMTCIYLSPDRLPDKWLLVKCVVVQIISCIIFIPFYYRRERSNAEYVKEMKTRRDVLSSMNESSETLDEKTMQKNYLMMMNETAQNKKFAGTKENEILDFDREPKDYSKEYLGGISEKSDHLTKKHSKKYRSRTTENIPESSESISKLVDEYYKKQFDKYTYSK